MTNFEQKILATLAENPGLKAKDIADRLGVERKRVNSALYSSLKVRCYQDSSYCWFLNSAKKKTATVSDVVDPPDKRLVSLCKYYLNCLSLEENNGISAYLTSKYSLNYTELKTLNINGEDESTANLLKKTSRGKTLTAYLGYPVMIEKFYSTRTNQEYSKIAPVFLFSVDVTAGEVKVDTIPSVNMEVIKQYSSRDVNSQMYDKVDLETELGLNNADAEIEIDELVSRLQSIRQWQWKEAFDPSSLCASPPVSEITEEGIYNRAVLIVTERSPYTVGLESELSLLMTADENSYRDTALYDWIHRPKSKADYGYSKSSENLLEVLPLNSEQEQAVSRSLIENLTIVTGPPGTGKSQVVTDLLINAALQKQNTIFASKNNKAVDVVDTRINSLGIRPIMLRIGGSQYASHLAELISNLLSQTANQTDLEDYNRYIKLYQNKSLICNKLKKQRETVFAFRNQVDSIEQKVCEVRDKWEKWIGQIFEDEIELFSKEFNVYELYLKSILAIKKSLFGKLFWFVIGKSKIETLESKVILLNTHLRKYEIEEIKQNFDFVDINYYERKCQEISEALYALLTIAEYQSALNELSSVDSIEKIDKQLYEQKEKLADIAKSLWGKWLLIRPLKIDAKSRIEMTQFITAMKLAGDVDLGEHPDLRKKFRKLQKEMTNYLPCWAVTSLSVKGRVPFRPGIFDLVVIDEASQCDIASVLPLLYRAKRAVIIGDPKQLTHICSISKAQDIKLIQKHGVDLEWSYSANSLYTMASSIVDADQVINLLDHHRSVSEIIEFSNSEFYDNKLRVATNYDRLKRPKNMETGIRWIDTQGKTIRPSSGSAYNEAEVASVLNELKRLVVNNDYDGNVGVVTPFRAQADRIREAIRKSPELKLYLDRNNDFLVDTVHKFQGDERDVIFFSPVISKGTNSSAIEFLNNTGNLFNVAITRARAVLVVTGDMSYCGNCSVSYMENFVTYVRKCNERIRKQMNISHSVSTIREYPTVSNPEQVSDWEKILYLALYDAGIYTIPQHPVDKYKLDLALITGEHKLDIEVDGEMYHKDWNGELRYRDQLRNQRMFEMGCEAVLGIPS
jgi:hypothetical protein